VLVGGVGEPRDGFVVTTGSETLRDVPCAS